MYQQANLYTFDAISIGLSHCYEVEITQKKIDLFYALTHDDNPLHTDLAYAKSKGFETKVVYGLLTSSFLSTFAGIYLPGKYALIHEIQMAFLKPVYLDDVLCICGSVQEKQEAYQQIKLKMQIKKQGGGDVARGYMKIGVLK